MKVFSMFDGVGGFIIGLNNAGEDAFQTLYSNQYEPSKKAQDAFDVGVHRFPGLEHIGMDVAAIPNAKFEEMRERGVDMIVGGFPCQDYSVARSKKHEMGIEGKKGVLFWQIIRATEHIKPKYLVLENVDRLLKAPSKQRGRDFAVMLTAFNQLGYSVEWRVINAAEYGCAQRRRRVFFFIYRNDTAWARHLDQEFEGGDVSFETYKDYLLKKGLFARQFPVAEEPAKGRIHFNRLGDDIVEVSENFSDGKMWNSGVMRHGVFYTCETTPIFERAVTLGEIVQPDDEVDGRFYLSDEKVEKFKYLRGPKKLERVSSEGHTYTYSEGGMSEFDSLDLPGRTMLTSEGTVNRSTHFLKTDRGYRLLTPIEAERLQGFPDDWTRYKKNPETGEIEEVSDRMRWFFMGNALVTTIVTRIGKELKKIDDGQF